MLFNYSIDSVSRLPTGFIGFALIAGVFWLVVLASALSRKDFDPVTKFMWVFVIVTASIFGALLYLCIAPSASQVRRAASDYTSEPTTCAACRATIPAGSSVCPKCGWTYDVAKPS